jgi:hypothetical protein
MTLSEPSITAVRALADRFASWQTPYGKPDPARCPFVTPGPCISTQFHSPTFLAIALYQAAAVLGEIAYKEAADRYIAFYFAALRHPPAGGCRLDHPAYPFQYGMALAAYEAFRRQNPDETWLDAKAAAVLEWVLSFRWDEGSYFRNGYGHPKLGIVDCGFSEDNLNIGRGLVAYHAVSGDPDALEAALGLADYYLDDLKLGTYDGCWSDALGTWAVGPTLIDNFEHFQGRRSFEIAWGFTAIGTIEYLTRLAPRVPGDEKRVRIADRCTRSLRWQFDVCQFEDGACGLAGRDDKWLGMTAGAILSFLRLREAGFLTPEDETRYRPRALAAARWLLGNTTPENIDERKGYLPVTAQSEARPPENLAWMLAWTLTALTRLDEI